MKQTTHQNKANLLREELLRKIKLRISIAGRESRVNNYKGIVIHPPLDTHSETVKEIQDEYMIVTGNLYYGYECLTLDEMAQLADLINA